MVGTGIVGAGLGAYQTISSAQQASEAKKALENYDRQTLKNVAEDLQVSRLGADLQRESQAQLSAGQVEALQGAGVRGIIGGMGRVDAQNQAVNQQISADLDQQQKQIDMMVASDNGAIRNMQENREVGDIGALSSQYNTGQQNMYQGLGNTFQGLGMIGNQVQKSIDEEKANKALIEGAMGGMTQGRGGSYSPTIVNNSPQNYSSNASSISNLASGMATKTAGSGMGAMNQQFDEYGQPINPYGFNFNPVQRRPRVGGLGATNY